MSGFSAGKQMKENNIFPPEVLPTKKNGIPKSRILVIVLVSTIMNYGAFLYFYNSVILFLSVIGSFGI